MISPARGLALALAVAAAFFSAVAVFAAPSPSPDAVRVKKTEVFDRPEFKSAEVKDNWFIRAVRAFIEWLGDFSAVAQVVFWLILAACIALILAIVVYAIYTVRKSYSLGRLGSRRDGSHAARIMLSASYRLEAERRAATGDFTEAIRYLFLSLVYRFDEQGRVSLDKAYTNRQYLGLLGDRTPVRAALRLMVDFLDDHWYGQRPCEHRQYEEFLTVYERLNAAV
ncbi:MAG TPA: hypothetical protein VGL71_05160 [Urbifossiella sp.]|jgi:hypothetical protein